MNKLKQAGDIVDYLQEAFFADATSAIVQGAANARSQVLVGHSKDAAAYAAAKVVVHDKELARNGVPLILDTNYAGELLRFLLTEFTAARKALDPLTQELMRTRAELAVKKRLLQTLEENIVELTSRE